MIYVKHQNEYSLFEAESIAPSSQRVVKTERVVSGFRGRRTTKSRYAHFEWKM